MASAIGDWKSCATSSTITLRRDNIPRSVVTVASLEQFWAAFWRARPADYGYPSVGPATKGINGNKQVVQLVNQPRKRIIYLRQQSWKRSAAGTGHWHLTKAWELRPREINLSYRDCLVSVKRISYPGKGTKPFMCFIPLFSAPWLLTYRNRVFPAWSDIPVSIVVNVTTVYAVPIS